MAADTYDVVISFFRDEFQSFFFLIASGPRFNPRRIWDRGRSPPNLGIGEYRFIQQLLHNLAHWHERPVSFKCSVRFTLPLSVEALQTELGEIIIRSSGGNECALSCLYGGVLCRNAAPKVQKPTKAG